MPEVHPLQACAGVLVPAWLMRRPEVTPLEKLVYGLLVKHSGRQATPVPAADELARELGCEAQLVDEALRSLKKLKLIEGRRGRGGANRLNFCRHAWTDGSQPSPEETKRRIGKAMAAIEAAKERAAVQQQQNVARRKAKGQKWGESEEEPRERERVYDPGADWNEPKAEAVNGHVHRSVASPYEELSKEDQKRFRTLKSFWLDNVAAAAPGAVHPRWHLNCREEKVLVNLMRQYEPKVIETLFLYACKNWRSIHKRMFKCEGSGVPDIVFLERFASQLVQDARLWQKHSKALDEYERWRNSQTDLALPDAALERKYEQAKKALQELRLEL